MQNIDTTTPTKKNLIKRSVAAEIRARVSTATTRDTNHYTTATSLICMALEKLYTRNIITIICFQKESDFITFSLYKVKMDKSCHIHSSYCGMSFQLHTPYDSLSHTLCVNLPRSGISFYLHISYDSSSHKLCV